MTVKNSLAYNKIQEEKRYRKPDLPNCVNRNADAASELDEREVITDGTFCAMKKMLPFVLEELAKIKDYRKKKVKYSLGIKCQGLMYKKYDIKMCNYYVNVVFGCLLIYLMSSAFSASIRLLSSR